MLEETQQERIAREISVAVAKFIDKEMSGGKPKDRLCPWCGCDDLKSDVVICPGGGHQVICKGCRARGPIGKTEAEAIDEWNGSTCRDRFND